MLDSTSPSAYISPMNAPFENLTEKMTLLETKLSELLVQKKAFEKERKDYSVRLREMSAERDTLKEKLEQSAARIENLVERLSDLDLSHD